MPERAVHRADPVQFPLREGSKATRQQPRRHLERHPLEVVRAWARRLRDADLDGALALYAPSAVLHADGRDVTGRSHVAAWLESSAAFRSRTLPDLRGDGDVIVARWRARDASSGLEVRSRIDSGLVAEQWTAPAAARAAVEAPTEGVPVSIAVVTRGPVDADVVDYATHRIAEALAPVKEHVLFARMKLTRAGDRARERPAIAEISVDVEGDVVRAQVAAHELREAADLLQARLRDKFDHRRQRWAARRARTGVAGDGEWRHGDLPTARPAYFVRPPEERELVRHKVFVVQEMTVDEAAFDMDQADYDFLLFREMGTGDDALLERAEDGSYHLTRLHGSGADPGPTSIPLTVRTVTPPVLGVAEAIRRLDDVGDRFVFFADVRSGRGNVAYLRYDGQYGLLSAHDE